LRRIQRTVSETAELAITLDPRVAAEVERRRACLVERLEDESGIRLQQWSTDWRRLAFRPR
jgi:hypothetical protein